MKSYDSDDDVIDDDDDDDGSGDDDDDIDVDGLVVRMVWMTASCESPMPYICGKNI